MGHSTPDDDQKSSSPPRRSGPQPSSPRAAAEAGQPRVWLVLGDKKGDNGQVEVVAQALGWICERKHVAMREPYVHGKPHVHASLHHIDLSRSDALAPPWPDLIITIGRRPSMVALWIREQSGGRAKIVVVGKPSGRLQWYDLIVSSAENAVAPYPHVVPITLPLMRVDQAAIAAAGKLWEARLAALPRPLIGVLVGGPTVPFVYKRAMVDRLLEVCRHIIEAEGGTPYFTTSRRTPAAVLEALRARLPAEARLFAWSPEAEDNPYRGLLAHADGFIVTADSISMMVEVAQVRKPLAILPVPVGPVGALDQLRRAFIRWLFATERDGPAGSLRQACARGLYRLRLVNQTRNFEAFHRMLFDRGLAVPVDQGFASARGQLPDDVPGVVARIKALMAAG